MSLLDKASLILVPGAPQKASEIFAAKPVTQSIGVTRGTTKLRTNASGLLQSVAADVAALDYRYASALQSCPAWLVEPAATNLARASEDFSNLTYWFPTNVTITANQTISPDGTQNADLANFTAGTNAINQGNVFAGNSDVTISVFVKANTISIFRIRESFYSGVSCVFDLSAQTAGAGGKLENYGNGWFRCSFTYNLGVGQTNVNWVFDSNTAVGSLYLWGAQAELGTIATSYIPTTNAAATRNADVITVTPPAGTSRIVTTFENGTSQVLTSIPPTFTIPNGRISKVTMR